MLASNLEDASLALAPSPSVALTRCPRCSARLLTPNADGDLECLCGNVVYAAIAPTPPDTPAQQLLSPRQRELMHWVAMGAQNRQIALNLGVSGVTLKTHIRAIRDRLSLGESRDELVAVARRLEAV